MPSYQLTVNGRVCAVDAEADTPLALPAVLNGVFATTGRRIRRLPLGSDRFA